MRIDKNFLEEEPRLHDTCFSGFHYDTASREIQVELTDCFQKKRFFLRFLDVELFEMQSCEFWSPADRVYGWEIIKNKDDGIFACSLFRKPCKEEPQEPSFQNLDDMVESVLSLVSGDSLSVVSRAIDFKELPYVSEEENNKS